MPKPIRLLLILLIFLFSALSGCRYALRNQSPDDAVSQSSKSIPTTLESPFGNPSNATADAGNSDNYLLIGPVSTISYNNSRGTANWISWRTTKADLGDSIERPDFESDARLPRGFTQITTFDYVRSGFDRGHLVPSADRFAKPQENSQTFLMSNIVPQSSDLNQFPWNKLEMYARSLARGGNDVYTIAGVYGEQERLRGKVTVPTNCWKIIVVAGRSTNGTIDEKTRIIAVDMPNIAGIKNVDWKKYRTSIRSIEQKTGYDFFRQLPRELQDAIENRVDGK